MVGIPVGAGYAPLVADLFLFCYELEFVVTLSGDGQASIIDTFNTTSRYLDDILNIGSVYFDSMVSQVCHSGLQLGRANTSDTGHVFRLAFVHF